MNNSDIIRWCRDHLEALTQYPCQGELSMGQLMFKYYWYNEHPGFENEAHTDDLLTEPLNGYEAATHEASPVFSKTIQGAGPIVNRLAWSLLSGLERWEAIAEFDVDNNIGWNAAKKSSLQRARREAVKDAFENWPIAEGQKKPDILYRGSKKGRTYRHRDARVLLEDNIVAQLIPTILETTRQEKKWSEIHPILIKWIEMFHTNCEDSPNFWTETPTSPITILIDPVDDSPQIVDGRGQFSCRISGLTPEQLNEYTGDFGPNLGHWIENVYTKRWFVKSSANIQRKLPETVVKGTKRGTWTHSRFKHNSPDMVIQHRRGTKQVEIKTSSDGFFNFVSSNDELFESFKSSLNHPSEPRLELEGAETDRAKLVLMQERLQQQLSEIEGLLSLYRELEDPESSISQNHSKHYPSANFEKSTFSTRRQRLVEITPDPRAIKILREWRQKKAQGVPAYQIFSNRTMEALATEKPSTHEELLEIHGIGPTKLEEFGDELLLLLKSIDTDTSAAAAA